MGAIVAIAYPNRATAKRALTRLNELQELGLIQIDDAVVARHLGDKIRLDQAVGPTIARDAATGALWGGLFAIVFAAPIVGAVVGAAGGALVGKLSDYGIDDKFAEEMGATVTRPKVALVVLVRTGTPDRVIAEMQKGRFGGKLIQTSLSPEAEAKLRTAFAGT